jgi:5'-nucleotidase
VGVNVNYSGTVAAAKEAALYGLPAIAVSVQGREVVNYDDVAAFTEALAETVLQKGLPLGTFLNVNVPNLPFTAISGTMPSRQGIGQLAERFEKRTDPRNQAYYWSGIDSQVFDGTPDADGAALEENHISITPIKCDMTDYDALENLRRWRWTPKGIGQPDNQ